MATFVKTATTGIVTTFGRFTRTMRPGLNFYIPIIQNVYHVSNRTHQKDFNFRIKTKDNVFANLSLALQYRIDAKNAPSAFFALDRPIEQMAAYIENSLRSHAPQTTLANLFESFDDIGHNVTNDLKSKMESYGFTIENILMTGIDPDPEVTSAINTASASERLMDAARNQAAAEYIKKVKEAEADRDRKILQGQGVAGQRKAIIDGYKENIAEMVKIGMSPVDVMRFILHSQELDMKEQVGRSSNTKVLFMEGMNNKGTSGFVSALETQYSENKTAQSHEV